MKNKLKFICAAVSALILAGGCSNPAKPVPDSGFLEHPQMMKHCDLLPIHEVWKDPSFKNANYDKIMIMPVYTKKQLPKSWLERNNMRTWLDVEDQDTADFAKYTEDAFKTALKENKNNRFKLVDKPGPGVLVLELALVKIVPGKPAIGTLKNLSNLTPIGFILVPIKMTKQANTESPMESSVAIEGRIRDGATGKVIAMFKDRKKQETAFFNLDDFRAYGNLKDIMEEWARQFVMVLNKAPLDKGVKYENDNIPVKVINY
ncbi:MAG: hypothetical protein A2017_08360 [Lentisphaerae bacterium GWF2_44_16]|nr:MAG: hypothetical protein A2017_08360 [Lentisphaerae bacterium GWF2_44_16]